MLINYYKIPYPYFRGASSVTIILIALSFTWVKLWYIILFFCFVCLLVLPYINVMHKLILNYINRKSFRKAFQFFIFSTNSTFIKPSTTIENDKDYLKYL